MCGDKAHQGGLEQNVRKQGMKGATHFYVMLQLAKEGGETPVIPAHPDDKRPLVELADGEPSSEVELRKEAASSQHLLTHFPKNPYCKVCSMSSTRAARKPDGRSDDFLDVPTAPLQQVATDSVILAMGEGHTGVGHGGIKSPHVRRDVYSGAVCISCVQA